MTCSKCGAKIGGRDIASGHCSACGHALSTEKDTWVAPSPPNAADQDAFDGAPRPNQDSDATIVFSTPEPIQPPSRVDNDEDERETTQLSPEERGPKPKHEPERSRCSACNSPLTDVETKIGQCKRCGHILLSNEDTWVPSGDNAIRREDDSQQTIVLPEKPAKPSAVSVPKDSSCPSCHVSLPADAIAAGRCLRCGYLLLSDRDTWMPDDGASDDSNEGQATVLLPVQTEEPAAPSSMCPTCHVALNEEDRLCGRCRQCGALLLSNVDTWILPTPPAFTDAACPSCQTELSDDDKKSGTCPACGFLLLSTRDTWSPTMPAPAPDAANDEDPGAATVLVGRGGVSQTGGEADATGFDLGPGTPPAAESGQTILVGEAENDVQATMQLAWNDSFDDVPAGMTIRAESGHAAPAKESLVIKPRAVRESLRYDPSNDEYELINKLGEGGMGVVYRARQTSINRGVALKMLKPGISQDDEQRQKFLTEAVVTGDLDHPNIVPIYDVASNEQGALFYSMKQVHGTPWLDVLSEKPLHENLDILMRVADAVAFAHDRGVVHRDLKPENVMLGDYGEVLVMDWGLARPTAQFKKSASITETNSMGGTPAYMAPEMATGPLEKIGPASDIYLLGAILWEIVTGNPPHTGKTAMKCLMAAAKNRIVPTDKTGELVDIGLRAMAMEPEERYPTVQAFQQAIRDYLAHTESIAMSARARDDLIQAEQSDDYDDYAKAMFLFQEAYELWDGNKNAREGISTARLAYATSAFHKGDYDLATSLLQANDPAHAELLTQIKDAQAEREARQQRLKTYKRIGLVSATIFVVVVSGLSIWANLERREAVRQRGIAITNEAEATRQKGIALENEQVAIAQRQRAEENEKVAVEQRNLAKENEQKAIAAKEREEYEAYIARIGLAAAKIDENAFDTALELLKQCEPGPNEKDLRHWEWGRLMHLCRQSLRSFPAAAKLNDVALDGSGHRFARAGEAGLVEIVDIASGKTLMSFPHGKHTVYSVCWSPDDAWLVTGSDDSEGYVKLWDTKTGQLLRNFTGHTDAVLCTTFSKDGSQLLTSSRDKSARLWDTKTGGLIREFLGHTWWVWAAAFSPDETRIVTAGQDGIAIVWNARTGQVWTPNADGSSSDNQPPFRAFTGHDGPIFAATFAPDGKTIATAGYDRRILIWDPAKLKPYNFENIDTDQPVAPPSEFIALKGHTASVRSVHFSEEGRLLVSAGNDNTIKVWNTETGKAITTFRGHDSWVRSAVFDPETHWVLSASHDNTVKQWGIDRYEEIRVLQGRDLEGHANAVLTATFSPDGQTVVTASEDRTAKTWNSATGAEELTLREGHEFLTSSSLFFPDGQTLLTAAVDNTVRFWNVATGTEFRRLDKTGRSATLALSHDSRWIATGGMENDDGTWQAQLWNAGTGALVRTFQAGPSEVTAVAFSGDDAQVLAGDSTGRCLLFDRVSGKTVRRFEGHNGRIVAAVFTPDNRRLLTASQDNTVAQWDVATGREDVSRVLKHPDSVTGLSVTDDARLAATSCADHKIRIWNVQKAIVVATISPRGRRATFAANVRSFMNRRNLKWTSADLAKRCRLPEDVVVAVLRNQATLTKDLVAQFAAGLETTEAELYQASVSSVALSPDGRSVLAVNPIERTLPLWKLPPAVIDRPSGLELPTQPALELKPSGGLLWSARYSPHGAFVVSVGGSDARLFNAQSGEELMKFSPHGAVAAANFSPDAKRIVTAGWDNSARVWDAQTGRDLVKLEGAGGHTGRVQSAVFSPDPDGRWIVTASDDHTAKLWDSHTGHVIRTFTGHTAEVRQATFSSDGRRILTASNDHTAALWDVETGDRLRLLTGHNLPVLCAAFSGDGNRVVTGSADNSAIVWDANTGQCQLTLTGHTAAVTSVAFAPDGDRVLTGSEDYLVKLWDATTRNESGQAKEILTLTGHAREVTSVRFSPDGQNALTASRDGKAILWLAAAWNTTE